MTNNIALGTAGVERLTPMYFFCSYCLDVFQAFVFFCVVC